MISVKINIKFSSDLPHGRLQFCALWLRDTNERSQFSNFCSLQRVVGYVLAFTRFYLVRSLELALVVKSLRKLSVGVKCILRLGSLTRSRRSFGSSRNLSYCVTSQKSAREATA